MDAIIKLTYLLYLHYSSYYFYHGSYYWPAPRFRAASAARKRGDVLGFQALHVHGKEIIRLNNGQDYKTNPCTQLLEQVCGFTMHAQRPGTESVLRSGPESLLRAFDIARCKGIVDVFFTGDAFDRTADPCLEGRLGRILAFLETHVPRDEESPCNVCSGTGKVKIAFVIPSECKSPRFAIFEFLYFC